MSNYRQDAASDARDFVAAYIDQIVEQLIDSDEASTDFNNDYPNGNSYHHETYVDKWYDLSDAAEVLDELSDYEETDNGLWEGLKPRAAIGAQAAYTYGNAVYQMAVEIIEEINSDYDADDFRGEPADEDEEGEIDAAKVKEFVENYTTEKAS